MSLFWKAATLSSPFLRSVGSKSLLALNGNNFLASKTLCSKSDPKAEDNNGSQDMPDPTLTNPYRREKRQCILCKYSIKLDYKFVSSFTGRVYDKHVTGLCDAQQKLLERELVKASKCALVPAVHKEARFMRDPPLFDPFRPQRPHPY